MTECPCPESLRAINAHAPGCVHFKNMLPNEVIPVYVPAPNTAHRIAVSVAERQHLVELDQLVAMAARVRNNALVAMAERYQIPLGPAHQQCWTYDFPTGTWTRTR